LINVGSGGSGTYSAKQSDRLDPSPNASNASGCMVLPAIRQMHPDVIATLRNNSILQQHNSATAQQCNSATGQQLNNTLDISVVFAATNKAAMLK
jgi:hypothetical protein